VVGYGHRLLRSGLRHLHRRRFHRRLLRKGLCHLRLRRRRLHLAAVCSASNFSVAWTEATSGSSGKMP
jgi:hypothetical protein